MEILKQPWPWYIAGPIIGLLVPVFLLVGNKRFGISSSLQHTCAALIPANLDYFKYNWRSETWNLLLVAGIALGAFLASVFFPNPPSVAVSAQTVKDLNALGIADQQGLVPSQIFNWGSLTTLPGFLFMVLGGLFVGFGTRYANGCTSGHSITGLANLELSSLVATVAFFAGGLITTFVIFPLIL